MIIFYYRKSIPMVGFVNTGRRTSIFLKVNTKYETKLTSILPLGENAVLLWR
jgi:hypothetical protein